jgi:photosystem II stability/assembly factor-like uncharacterized protein
MIIWLALAGAAACGGSRRSPASSNLRTPAQPEVSQTAGPAAISPPVADATIPPPPPTPTAGSLSILAVHFVDVDVGWAIQVTESPTPERLVLRTVDGGASWTVVARVTFDIDRIEFVDRLHGWAASDAGALLTTADGGESWSVVARGGAISSMSFVSRDIGWVVGLGYELAVTGDGGRTWKPVTTPCRGDPGEHIRRRVSFTSASFGVLECSEDGGAGFEGKEVYSTADGGSTWKEIPGSIGSGEYVSDVFALDQTHWWYTTSYAVADFYSSENGGASWKFVPLPGGRGYFNWLSEPQFIDTTHGWVVAARNGTPPGTIFATSDGGNTWTPLSVPPVP